MERSAPASRLLPEKKYGVREALRAAKWMFAQSPGIAGKVRWVIIFSASAALLTLFVPLMIGQAIDLFPRLREMARPLMLLALCFLLNAFSENRQGATTAYLSQKLVFDLRAKLCSRMLGLPIPEAENRPQGDLMSRLTNDTEVISQTVAGSVPRLITSVITIAGCLIMIWVQNRTLALTAALFGLLSMIPSLLAARPMQRRGQDQQKELGQLNAVTSEDLEQRETILAFNSQAYFSGRFDEQSGSFRRAGVRMQTLGAVMDPLLSLIGTCAFVCCVGIGAGALLEGKLTLGGFQACLVFTRQLIQPVSSLGMILSQLNGCFASIDRIREIVDRPDRGETGAVSAFAPDAAIVWRDVSFSYLRNVPLFDHLHLTFEPGKTTAIVGATGAGKTSMLNLMLKFYEPDGGTIEIGNTDLSRIPEELLYSRISVILQDQYMMPGTVAECISYGSPDASRDEIVQAARETGADEFIRQLPLGYNEPLDSENQLSRGQWQLLALSGVLLSRAEILLLDEATSSIDTCTEQKIQAALRKIMETKTCIIIAHRLSTILGADQILLMDHGRVAESGRHEELMAANGQYARLYSAGEIVD